MDWTDEVRACEKVVLCKRSAANKRDFYRRGAAKAVPRRIVT